MFDRRIPVAFFALALHVSRAQAQEVKDDDLEEAPVRIEDHGAIPAPIPTPAPVPTPGARGRKTPSKTPVLPLVIPPVPRLEVTVHEPEPPSRIETAEDAALAQPPERPARLDPDATAPLLAPDLQGPSEYELAEPRGPLADVELEGRLPWQRHGEIGAALAWVRRPFVVGDSRIRYAPAVGVALHLQWDIRPWLHVRPYFIMSTHEVDVPFGALSTSSPKSVRRDSFFSPIQARTFAFGAKVAPTWNASARARAWLVLGVGYGRMGFHGVVLTEPDGKPIEVPDRDGVFVEFPLGIGGAYEVLPGRAAFVFEATGAPAFGQSGNAHEDFLVMDSAGRIRELGAFSAFTGSFVQTFGLSILL